MRDDIGPLAIRERSPGYSCGCDLRHIARKQLNEWRRLYPPGKRRHTGNATVDGYLREQLPGLHQPDRKIIHVEVARVLRKQINKLLPFGDDADVIPVHLAQCRFQTIIKTQILLIPDAKKRPCKLR